MYTIPYGVPTGLPRGYAASVPGTHSLSEMAAIVARNRELVTARAKRGPSRPKTMADRAAEIDAMKSWLRSRGY